MRPITTLIVAFLCALAVHPGASSAAEFCMPRQGHTEGCDAIRARATLDAAQSPWRAIGRVNFAGYKTRMHCTGVLVGDALVLTAAHCLYDRTRQRWLPPDSLRFVAGYQDGDAEAVAGVTSYRLDPEQDQSGALIRNPSADWALLNLDATLGSTLGNLRLTAGAGNLTNGYVAGYAGLRQHRLTQTGNCPMRRHPGGVLIGACPVMQGDSGAPLLVETEAGPRVLGILSGVRRAATGIEGVFVPADLIDLTGP